MWSISSTHSNIKQTSVSTVTLPRGRSDFTSILVSTGEISQPPRLSWCLEFSLFSKSANHWSVDQKRPPCLPQPTVSCGRKTVNQGLTDAKVTESKTLGQEAGGGDGFRRGGGRERGGARQAALPPPLPSGRK